MTLGATALLFGVLSGFRHAFEPDHLTAVSTMVTERPGTWRAARLGAWWGLGHTAALAVVATLLTIFNTALPSSLEAIFEFAVALMLLLLGLRGISRALMTPAHERRSRSGWLEAHGHSGLPPHLHVGQRAFTLGPLAIGVVHGLAGSGALTALVMSSLPDATMRMLYTLLFGLASTAGMALVSGIAGLSLARFSQSHRALLGMSLLTGTLSIVVAVLWGWPIVQGWMLVR